MAFKMRGMKFYGDRTRKEMRQDIREERKSLKEHGGTRQDVKEFNKYQRGRKKEIRGEELLERGQKRGQKKIDKGSSIINRHKEPSVVTQKVRQFKNKRKHKKNLEKKSSAAKKYVSDAQRKAVHASKAEQ